MTDLDPAPASRQTNQLMAELAGHGFVEFPQAHGVEAADGSVTSEKHGIRVHADPDVVRIIIAERGEVPAYRLLVSKYALTNAQAIRIGAGIVRLIIEDREVAAAIAYAAGEEQEK
jgi:hypothetical protein